MTNKSQIEVENKLISIVKQDEQDYISLTDMVKGEEGSDHIRNWMRNRNTVEFLGLWETLNNPGFKPVEFDTFTAKDWREANPAKAKKGLNIRDFASINELVVLANLESLNSILILNQVDKEERYRQLRDIVQIQLISLDEKDFMKALKKVSDDIYIESKKKPE